MAKNDDGPNLFDARTYDQKFADAYRRFREIKPKAPLIGHGQPITSHALVAALTDSDRFTHRLERLLCAVYEAGEHGVIDDSLIVIFDQWAHSSVTAGMSWLRSHELVKAGPDTRRTRYGHAALVNRLA